ncbi:hypothetical protein ACFO0S_00355 [Chryseomicrobium palamuruense]|uniref:DUF4145 domain-containing protein n=1 Tax=Chryseomicrobium palamuruense TaxID=682973 RepID=A0ABV8UQE4_9BACL
MNFLLLECVHYLTLTIELITQPEITRRETILLLLAYNKDKPKSISEIKEIGKENGLRMIEKWNVANILSRSEGLCTKLKAGWIITSMGLEIVYGLIPNRPQSIQGISSVLSDLLEKIEDSNTKEFLKEAAFCFDSGCYRAASVLSWVGAISILYEYIVNHKLDDFNKEATRRNPKWQRAKNSDDLSRMKEKEFLDTISAISVIGKNVKQELEQCLTLRNGCSHPNSLKLGENRVASHIETLILNVYLRF